MQYGGNKVAGSIWLSTFHSSTPEPETDSDVRMFMRQKYYEQKWLDRSKAIEHSEKVKKIVMEMFLEDGTRRNSTGGSTRAQLSPTSPTSSFVPLPRNSLDSNRTSILAPPPTKQQSLDVTTNRTSALIPPPTKQSTESSRPKIVPTQSWVDDNTPIGLIPAVKSMVVNNLLLDEDLLGDHTTSLPGSPQSSTSINRQNGKPMSLFLSPVLILGGLLDFVLPKKPQVPLTVKSDIFSDLAELNPIKPIKSPTYSGGILQPNSPGNSSNIVSPRSINNNTIQPSPTNTTKPIDLDPYAALRGLSFGGK